MKPYLYIVAGAPGSGKSRAFPVSEFGVDFFNADDRAASLNGGSYHRISMEIRRRVNGEFERFIAEHIAGKRSMAYETTLRSPIVFEQLEAAQRNGFQIVMYYLGIEDVQLNLKRIGVRWRLGFHAAPKATLMAIHAQSLINLLTAIREADRGLMDLFLVDNTPVYREPSVVYQIVAQLHLAHRDQLPRWVSHALEEAAGGGLHGAREDD